MAEPSWEDRAHDLEEGLRSGAVSVHEAEQRLRRLLEDQDVPEGPDDD